MLWVLGETYWMEESKGLVPSPVWNVQGGSILTARAAEYLDRLKLCSFPEQGSKIHHT